MTALLVKIQVTDRNGVVREIESAGDVVLMEVLRDLPYGVAAVCGGMLLCGTCHVYLCAQDAGRFALPSNEESLLLESIDCRQPTSRLSCQLYVTPEFGDFGLTIAPGG